MASVYKKSLITNLVLIISTFLAFANVLASPMPCYFPAIFNFGDSNSDTGGYSAAFRPRRPPNGETFFGKPMGRYCDGRLLNDFIANSLGLPYLSAYLDSIGANFSHGANFATAGSSIRKLNPILFLIGFSPFPLDVQYWQFSQFKSRSQDVYKQGGIFQNLLPKEEYFSQALYTIDIGQNDLTSSYFSNMTTEEIKATIPDILNKFTIVIQSIYGQGGRYFWIHNTGPLGCLPYVLVRFPALAVQVDKAGCGVVFNEVAQLFNKKLKETVYQLRKEFPLASFTYVDVYSVKYSLISEALKHGFEHPLVACCGYGGGKYNYDMNNRCGKTIVVNGTEILIGKSCEKPETRIVWDGIHYTEAANKWVFDQISTGAFSDPPLSLNMACYKEAPVRDIM